MRNLYNFNDHINYIRVIAETSIQMAELINLYIKRMSKSLIGKVAMQLRLEHEEKYRKDDARKFASIRNALNMLSKEQVTNVDELFMGLAFQVNAYYGVKYLNLKKRVSYYQKCQYCKRLVSNYHFGRKIHEAKCSERQGANKNRALMKIKKSIGTQTNDYGEKIRNIKSQQSQDSLQIQQKSSKKIQLIKKKKAKSDARRRIIQVDQDDIYDGAMNFNHLTDEMYYYEDNDESLMKKGDEKTLAKFESSNDPSENNVKQEHFGSSQQIKNDNVNSYLSLS